MRDNLISVICPVYNAEKFVGKAIESVLNQSYKNFELILINDGSTDSSLNICKKYASRDNRVTIISQENKGQFYARKAGLKKANGDYVLFLDSDDFFNDLSFFEKLNQYIVENIDVDIIVFGFINISNGKETSRHLCRISSKNDYKECLLSWKTNSLWSKLFKKSLFNEFINNSNTYLEKESEDLILQLLIADFVNKVITMDGYFYSYVFNKNSTLNKTFTIDCLNKRINTEAFNICKSYALKWNLKRNIIENIEIIKINHVLMRIKMYLRNNHFLDIFKNRVQIKNLIKKTNNDYVKKLNIKQKTSYFFILYLPLSFSLILKFKFFLQQLFSK